LVCRFARVKQRQLSFPDELFRLAPKLPVQRQLQLFLQLTGLLFKRFIIPLKLDDFLFKFNDVVFEMLNVVVYSFAFRRSFSHVSNAITESDVCATVF
jgi:hypothetical protein